MGFAAVVSAIPLVPAVSRVRVIDLKPVWWLLRDASHGERPDRTVACQELSDRARRGSLSPADEQRIVRFALKSQADLSVPWDPRLGDVVEWLRGSGRLTPTDWQAYVAHATPTTFTVRGRCGRGDPLRLTVRGELRGGSPTRGRRGASPDCTVDVPAAALEARGFRGVGGDGTFSFDGTARLLPASAAALRPGPQQLAITLIDFDFGVASNAALAAPLVLNATWTLLDDADRPVKLYRDSALADRVRNSLTVQASPGRYFGAIVDDGLDVTVHTLSPAAALVEQIVVRVGGQEYVGREAFVANVGLRERRQLIHVQMPSVPLGSRIDVLIRPDSAVAWRDTNVVRLLDHEFAFKDVPVITRP